MATHKIALANNQIVELTGLVEIRDYGVLHVNPRLPSYYLSPTAWMSWEPTKGTPEEERRIGRGCEAIETRILPSLRVPARSWRTTS